MTATAEEKPVLSDETYPTDWDAFIGQDKAKLQIRMAIQSAKMRGERVPHMLIASGKSGVGKTALAKLTAQEIGTNLKVVSGPIDRNQAVVMLADMDDGDVLYWDEYHLSVVGGKSKAEWQLNYLQDGVMLGPLGPDPNVPQVTFLASTTEAGRLPTTVVNRYPVTPTIVDYTDEHATRITLVTAPKIFKDACELPDHDAAEAVARAANNNPRAITMILSTMRDFGVTMGRYSVQETLEFMDITPDGLDRTMQRYLVALVTRFPGTAGEKALQDALEEPGGLSHIERVLFGKGLVGMAARGRYLQSPGARRAKELIAAGVVV